MSELKEPKIGDKIIIPEGFTLVGFEGNYKKVYEIANYFFDDRHSMHFITFEADGKKYTFPPMAFDLASAEEIEAGHRIDTKQIEDIGDDRDMSQHISPNCKAKDV